jgi:hypothetical protein
LEGRGKRKAVVTRWRGKFSALLEFLKSGVEELDGRDMSDRR